jgi:hypothetical protein
MYQNFFVERRQFNHDRFDKLCLFTLFNVSGGHDLIVYLIGNDGYCEFCEELLNHTSNSIPTVLIDVLKRSYIRSLR